MIFLVIYLIVLVHVLMFDQLRIRARNRDRECEALAAMELEMRRNLERLGAGDVDLEQLTYRTVACSGALARAPLSLIALAVTAYDSDPQHPADRARVTQDAMDAIAAHRRLYDRRKAAR